MSTGAEAAAAARTTDATSAAAALPTAATTAPGGRTREATTPARGTARARIAVCDCGAGNMRSVERALERAGAEVTVTAEPGLVLGADGVVLPGVGAFAPAAVALRELGLASALQSVATSGRPLLGVCLGFQLLFSDSDEGRGERGLDIIPGAVRRLRSSAGVRVPHVGWNTTAQVGTPVLFDGITDGAFLYYTHSYAAVPAEPGCVVATTEHGGRIVAAVAAGSVSGTQFHPEKSGPAGLRMYANFVAMCRAPC